MDTRATAYKYKGRQEATEEEVQEFNKSTKSKRQKKLGGCVKTPMQGKTQWEKDESWGKATTGGGWVNKMCVKLQARRRVRKMTKIKRLKSRLTQARRMVAEETNIVPV